MTESLPGVSTSTCPRLPAHSAVRELDGRQICRSGRPPRYAIRAERSGHNAWGDICTGILKVPIGDSREAKFDPSSPRVRRSKFAAKSRRVGRRATYPVALQGRQDPLAGVACAYSPRRSDRPGLVTKANASQPANPLCRCSALCQSGRTTRTPRHSSLKACECPSP
jgi:hypothetical protein